MKLFRIGLLALSAVVIACSTRVDAPVAPAYEESVKPGINENFLSDELDVARYLNTFEGESREIAQYRDNIVASLDLEPGMELADVGAGTGLFLSSFAGAVGQEGRVYAVDISPKFLEFLAKRVEKEGLNHVSIVHCEEKSVSLPDDSVDAVFVCDTYHHFEYPRSTTASIRAALRSGGRLYVVDFERIPGVTREWVLDHVRAGKETFLAEIVEAGFTYLEEREVEGLEENYLLVFERP